jgi:hypothetical protein
VRRRQGKTFVVSGDAESDPFKGQLIASETTCPDWEANARLISAAPELLKACEAFAKEYEAVFGTDYGDTPVEQIAFQCRKAIAKAKGEV